MLIRVIQAHHSPLQSQGSELAIDSDGVLTFASAPDYETKTSYTATVTAK